MRMCVPVWLATRRDIYYQIYEPRSDVYTLRVRVVSLPTAADGRSGIQVQG